MAASSSSEERPVGAPRLITLAEVWDPATATFGPAGSLSEGRIRHTATLLSDGRVLIVGGMNATGDLASAEAWEPVKPDETRRHVMLCPSTSFFG